MKTKIIQFLIKTFGFFLKNKQMVQPIKEKTLEEKAADIILVLQKVQRELPEFKQDRDVVKKLGEIISILTHVKNKEIDLLQLTKSFLIDQKEGKNEGFKSALEQAKERFNNQIENNKEFKEFFAQQKTEQFKEFVKDENATLFGDEEVLIQSGVNPEKSYVKKVRKPRAGKENVTLEKSKEYVFTDLIPNDDKFSEKIKQNFERKEHQIINNL